MAKKLNEKSIRQGQTAYVVCGGYEYNPSKPYVLKIFLHSKKQELPPEGCLIEKWPVHYFKKVVERGGNDFYATYSRRKAERKAKELNHYAGVNYE